jgi:hypothetical protein
VLLVSAARASERRPLDVGIPSSTRQGRRRDVGSLMANVDLMELIGITRGGRT